MPLPEALRQRLRHNWVGALVTDKSRVWLGGEHGLDLPFMAPLPAGASAWELVRELIAPCKGVERATSPHTVPLDDGRLLRLFSFPMPFANIPAHVRAGMEPVKRSDLPFLAAKNMLGPLLAQILAANVSL